MLRNVAVRHAYHVLLVLTKVMSEKYVHNRIRVVSLSKDTFTLRKVLVIPRKRWLHPDRTGKAFTGTLSLIKTKPNKRILPIRYWTSESFTVYSHYTPPQTVFVGGYTVFTSIRTNESVSVTFCFLNILKTHRWNLIKLCKNIHMYKANTTYKN